MSSTLLLLVSVLALTASVRAAKDHDKHDGHVKPENSKQPTCQWFTHGLTFNDSQALGTWHMLHYKTQTEDGSGDSKCVEFSLVNEQERKNVSEVLGKFVENINWEKLTLKMAISVSCYSDNPKVSRHYFLEKLEDDGSYRTLQIPSTTAAPLDLSKINRYPLRLKIIEGQYLAMMDCHEKFVFLLGKKAPEDAELDARLKKMMENYWPEEN